jgi:hypothetical protein
MRLLSRRDELMVARHEMPGHWSDPVRPVGNGMIGNASRDPSSPIKERAVQNVHTVPYGTVSWMLRFQAFHAWLPSFRPFGTIVRTGQMPSNIPIFQHSITRCDGIRARGRARARIRRTFSTP